MRLRVLFPLFFLATFILSAAPAEAFWVYSPDTGKWTNPKNVPKDSPEGQYTWAMEFYEKEDYARALDEFKKLTNSYPQSKMASMGQFYQAMCHEQMGDIGKAADAYRLMVDRYPYSESVNRAIEKEYELAGAMMDGQKVRFLGMDILPATDLAVQLYEHIVKRAPYGDYGVKSQYQLGHAYLKLGEFDDAERAFQDVMDDYPNTTYAQEAKYQLARVSYRASQVQEYHTHATDQAIEKFEGYTRAYPGSEMAYEANEMIAELRDKKAQSLFEIGSFYQSAQKYPSARVYYQDILSQFPDTPTAQLAREHMDQITILAAQEPEGVIQKFGKITGKSFAAIGQAPGKLIGGLIPANQPGAVKAAPAPPPAPAVEAAVEAPAEQMKDESGNWVTGMGRGIGNVGKGIGDGFGSVGKGIGSMGKGIGAMGKGVGDGIGTVGKGLGDGIGTMARGVGDATGAMVRLLTFQPVNPDQPPVQEVREEKTEQAADGGFLGLGHVGRAIGSIFPGGENKQKGFEDEDWS